MSAPSPVMVNTPFDQFERAGRADIADVLRLPRGRRAETENFPAEKQTPAPAASASNSTTTRTAAGNFFGGAAGPVRPRTGARGFFSPSPCVPVRMNFWSSDAGACGTVIFWKHVGHSITEPACDESHFMCWPHTGQAYLNSLMAVPKTFHIRAPLATRIFQVIDAKPPGAGAKSNAFASWRPASLR